MELTKDKLLAFWKIRKQIFADEKNAHIIKRYETTKHLFNEILKIHLVIDEQSVKINDKQVVIDGHCPSLSYSAGSRFLGI